jgi:Cupin-like domain
MSVSEYVTWWKLHHKIQRSKEFANNSKSTTCIDVLDDNVPLLYLKDWKFLAAHPNYNAYEWPQYFTDDWLNDAMGNAYKFVYLGPAGTSTPLHADVLRSYSWSTNICGIKKWILVPPALTCYLYDCFVFGGTTLPTYINIDVDYPGTKSFYPGLECARQHSIEIVQHPGETIYVPSNWFHTVINVRPTLSINHNWINGYNIRQCWDHTERELRSLRQRTLNQSPSKEHYINSIEGENNEAKTQIDEMLNTSSDTGEIVNDKMGQVDDDILLLWHVVSSKIRTVLEEPNFADNDIDLSYKIQCKIDCNAILHVLSGLQRVHENHLLSSSTSFVEQMNIVAINNLYKRVFEFAKKE